MSEQSSSIDPVKAAERIAEQERDIEIQLAIVRPCARCGDQVQYLSSDNLCDGCMSASTEQYRAGLMAAEFPLCDPDGVVRGGALHHGTDYPCTGHAHYAGHHIRCTSVAHAADDTQRDGLAGVALTESEVQKLDDEIEWLTDVAARIAARRSQAMCAKWNLQQRARGESGAALIAAGPIDPPRPAGHHPVA